MGTVWAQVQVIPSAGSSQERQQATTLLLSLVSRSNLYVCKDVQEHTGLELLLAVLLEHIDQAIPGSCLSKSSGLSSCRVSVSASASSPGLPG